MPTRNVNLTPELDAFVAERVASGRYANDSEVLSEGLRLFVESGKEKTEKIRRLRDELEKEISKPDFTVEEYETYLERRANLDDATKLELLRFELEEAEAGPDAPPDALEKLIEHYARLADEEERRVRQTA